MSVFILNKQILINYLGDIVHKTLKTPPMLNTYPAAYPRNLRAPVEHDLGADVGFVSADIVEQASERHELSDEHHLNCHTDRQDSDATRMDDGRHDPRLLQ